MLLVIGLEAHEDFHRIFQRWFLHIDLLEPAYQRPILLEVIAVFLVGGRPDAAQFTAGQCRLQQVRRIHGPTGGGTGTDHRMNLIDEQHGLINLFQFGDNRFQAFLEVTAIPGTGKQRAHIEREDGGFTQHLGHIALDDTPGETFRNGGFTHAGITDIKRVVLGATAQDLDRTLDLMLTTDQRIDLAARGLLVEVDAIGIKRLAALLDHLLAGSFLIGTAWRAALGIALARHLGDTVRDIIDRIETGHVLFLQEVDCMALPFGEQGDQHIGTGYLFPAGRLDMNGCPLQHTLETGGGFCILRRRDHEVGQFIVQIIDNLAADFVEIDIAGAHNRNGVLIICQGQEQMLKRRIFMTALIREPECPM